MKLSLNSLADTVLSIAETDQVSVSAVTGALIRWNVEGYKGFFEGEAGDWVIWTNEDSSEVSLRIGVPNGTDTFVTECHSIMGAVEYARQHNLK